jgi:dephospho-CoA kinase
MGTACTACAAPSAIRGQRNHARKIIGKPYAGKPHVRIERGMGKPDRTAAPAPLTTNEAVLLTGMSGTGKSSVIRALADLGYKAIDTDDGWCEQLPDGRQRWREDAIAILLATEDAEVLFVAGCEENQARFHPQFDRIILLSAPVQTMMQRLADRTSKVVLLRLAYSSSRFSGDSAPQSVSGAGKR